MRIEFYGDIYAKLYTKQLNASLAGGFIYNYVDNDEIYFEKGFLRASQKYNVWWDTCWTRDAGSFLREIAALGHYEKAISSAKYLIKNVTENPAGFYSFPMFFKMREKGFGTELDGTANIVIGLIELYKKTNDLEIFDFLTSRKSPVQYMLHMLKKNPLILGSGEFGGGWCVDGEYYNIVQNMLALSALNLYYEFIKADKIVLNATYLLLSNIEKYMLKDGMFIWCVDKNMATVDLSNHPTAYGTSNINGIAGAYNLGFSGDIRFQAAVKNTYTALIESFPHRKRLFEKYGMMTFTNPFPKGHELEFIGNTSWLAYCEAYLGEAAVYTKDRKTLTKAMRYIVTQTAFSGHMPEKFTENELVLQDNFYFTERNFSPEWKGIREEGCGKLNLINISEQLYLARMIAGLIGNERREPFLPEGWDGVRIFD